jgi:hypothetical protein
MSEKDNNWKPWTPIPEPPNVTGAKKIDPKDKFWRAPYLPGMAPKPTIPFNLATVGRTKNTEDVKTSTNANFTGLFFSALPNYSIQEALSLRSLTGNEILQVAHRENFYTTGEVLNRNIIDIVESREFYSPTQIIKLQMPDYSYLFQNNVAAYDVSLASSIVTISIPSSRITQSAKIQVETFAPRYIKNDTIYT